MKWFLHEHPDVTWSIVTALCFAVVFAWRRWVHPMWSKQRQAARERAIIYSQLGEVLEQFRPNGGSSLIDRVTSIQSNILELRREIVCLHSGMRFLFDSSDDALFWTDRSGETTQMSRAFTRWTGWQESELLGRNWMKMIPQDSRESVVRQWFDAVRQGIDFLLTYNFQDSQGRPFEVHTEATPIRHNGSVIAYRGTVRRTKMDHH